MKAFPAQPSLYQINTRVWLTELSKSLGRPATLDDIPDAELNRLAEMGFDWIWLLSVWQTGAAGQRISRSNPQWRDYILFYEYFHGDNGAGLGASHQTGWTGLVAKLIQLFGLLDAKQLLEAGKEAAFVR